MKRMIIATWIGLYTLLSPMGQAFSHTDSPPAATATAQTAASETITTETAATAKQEPLQIPVASPVKHGLPEKAVPPVPVPVPPLAHELWSGALYTSTYKAGVCIEADGSLRGVLLVRTMNGAVDPYHFYGTFKDGTLRASHGSGHKFKGSFKSDKEVTGTITLKSGRKITMTGKRQQNVPLTDTCRPLPE